MPAVRKGEMDEKDEAEPLVDLTAALHLHSKRTERLQKRMSKKNKNNSSREVKTLLGLPSELFIELLGHLRPSDVFSLARVNRSLNRFITEQEATIARDIVARRYSVMEKCFRAPVLLEYVDSAIHPALQREDRQEILSIHKKPFQHIKSPDPRVICTCMTCMLRWNALNLVIDFAHWQNNLDTGEPIPMIARGKYPEWNTDLIKSNGLIVEKALRSSLWYARILEAHLNSTVHSIRRQANNKGNQRRRFRMTADDIASETDAFLGRSGPPSLDFPFHRDNYYMLESYFPNRGWNQDQQRWMYMPDSQHERDIEFVARWDAIRQKRNQERNQEVNAAVQLEENQTASEQMSTVALDMANAQAIFDAATN